MKSIWRISLVFLVLAAGILGASCSQKTTPTGLLLGGVTIGPITPVQTPGQVVNVPPETFSSRKVLVYDESGKNLLQSVTINQIGMTADGYYAVQLKPGNYVVDINNTGKSTAVPRPITIVAGQDYLLDIDIDTGIR